MCGEKLLNLVATGEKQGSPPRVRGKVEEDNPALLAERITPACAGKSYLPYRSQPAQKDHPRVCGEKPPVAFMMNFVMGSPPRVRGKGVDVSSRQSGIRITPACAGKSLRKNSGQKLR